MLSNMKKFTFDEIKGFIAWLIISGGIAYGVYITVKFVLESNNWN